MSSRLEIQDNPVGIAGRADLNASETSVQDNVLAAPAIGGASRR